MEKIEYIYKTRPNYIIITFIMIGGLFFAYWAYAIFKMPWAVEGVSQQTGHVIVSFFLMLFGGFSIVCFALALSHRVFYVTTDKLIVKRRLLFYTRDILLKDIGRIQQKDEPIILKGDEIYRGRKAIIEINKGRRIKITSFEVWGYRGLISKLSRYRRK